MRFDFKDHPKGETDATVVARQAAVLQFVDKRGARWLGDEHLAAFIFDPRMRARAAIMVDPAVALAELGFDLPAAWARARPRAFAFVEGHCKTISPGQVETVVADLTHYLEGSGDFAATVWLTPEASRDEVLSRWRFAAAVLKPPRDGNAPLLAPLSARAC